MKSLFFLPLVALLAAVPVDTSTKLATAKLDVYLTPAARASLGAQSSYATLLAACSVDSALNIVEPAQLPAGVTILRSRFVVLCPYVDGGAACPPLAEVSQPCACAADNTCMATDSQGLTGLAPRGITLPGGGWSAPQGTGCIPKNCTTIWTNATDGGQDDGWPTVCPR